jgi:hypothetical protein
MLRGECAVSAESSDTSTNNRPIHPLEEFMRWPVAELHLLNEYFICSVECSTGVARRYKFPLLPLNVQSLPSMQISLFTR